MPSLFTGGGGGGILEILCLPSRALLRRSGSVWAFHINADPKPNRAFRAVDPHWCNADPDTDPDLAFFLIADLDPDPNADPDPDSNADPDPVPIPGFWWPKLSKNLQLEIYILFFWSKIVICLSVGLPKGRPCPSYRRSLQPSKENIQHFKHENSLLFFVVHFCIRIRIQRLRLMRIHADPCLPFKLRKNSCFTQRRMFY